MSDGKGEALASELAALSVEEAPATAETVAEKASADVQTEEKPVEKIKGVVNWFDVSKGFGTRSWLFQRGMQLLFSRERSVPSREGARAATTLGSQCHLHPFLSQNILRAFDAFARRRATPARLAIARRVVPPVGWVGFNRRIDRSPTLPSFSQAS
jgi:hypothetical protein